ncbi:Hypothetical predicted protein [Mytilus galloprovincialis]|uniref:C-type lectin domain-containing protein n=1 Tax=Mytilus galloprovincialis TaxID=29158 RepID=A0A8B6GJE8_MYTGA|nr:Hypothetical predicted protein [Mytilus galloprovincialis]
MILGMRSDSRSCPNGWFRNGTKCYFFSEELKTWMDAKLACEDDGGILVEVESKCENDFLKMSASEQWHWLGGTDEQEENVWLWSPSQNLIIFTNWNLEEPEPNNLNGNENCLALSSAYEFAWYDGTCNTLLLFICEKVTWNNTYGINLVTIVNAITDITVNKSEKSSNGRIVIFL